MTPDHARAVSLWKYGGEYAFYDNSEEDAREFMNGTFYSCLSDSGELTGYFNFGDGAKVPTIEENVYDEGFLDIGLRLKPDLCGKGLGLGFLNLGLDYARSVFNTRKFRLSVAAFNERAVKVYMKAGFTIESEVTNSYFGNKFYIMKLIRP